MSDMRRRKSLSIFRPTLPTVSTGSSDESSTGGGNGGGGGGGGGGSILRKKGGRPLSIFASRSTPSSPSFPNYDVANFEKVGLSESPKLRTRTLHKGSRASVFGSLRSLRSSEDDDVLTKTESKASSTNEENDLQGSLQAGLFGSSVLHHGEVQTMGGMFRKRSHYLVLTETHLLRFKGQTKAAEMYPVIPVSMGRSSGHRQSMGSFGSNSDAQSSIMSDIVDGIALNQIIATSKLDDGRPYFSIEVSHLEDATNRASSMSMQLNDPREADLWLLAIRNAAAKARNKHGYDFPPAMLAYIARALEHYRDYDPRHFQLFRVVQRTANKSVSRSSTDDLAKLNSSTCYLAVGINSVHLVPLKRSIDRSSTSSLQDLEAPTSFGITTLSSMSLQPGDDTFQLTFRVPLQSTFTLFLASAKAKEIVLWIKNRAEYLRPEWVHQPFAFFAPAELDDDMALSESSEDEHKFFDRTLIAYCAGFNVDVSRICYSVDYRCEDAPCFRLLKPFGPCYNALELLAVIRALRYNESFTSISFAGINLDVLQGIYDLYGVDFDALYTRSGVATNLPNQEELPLLSQEIRALALKSRRLRRLDFSYCLTRRQRSGTDIDTKACGIPEALVPLCKKTLTNVDWLVLNGIRLGDSDLDYLVDAASQRVCHLRALEIGNCGLSVHDIDVLLSTLAVQESTMEVIDISGVQGRFSPELFQRQIGYFGHIRKLNLTRVQKTAGPEPLVAPETLLTWRLEELQLSQTVVNQETVDSIAAYLASSKSDSLHELGLDQCGLTGKDLAIFFSAMSRDRGPPRDMHVSASENRLKAGYQFLFDIIGQNKTPTHLTMRMIEFEKEHHFRQLIQALQKNTALKVLDISKASLPYDAGEETCKELQKMFEQNSSLEELDISGEQAHLDSARFGIGLNLALTGLKKNNTLRMLKIEHQNLGMQGANTLAEVLEANNSLVEIHCENNDINLQSFTVLVNGLQKNTSVTYMPSMARDREKSLEKVKREIQAMNKSAELVSPSGSSSIKRTFTGVMSGRGNRPSMTQTSVNPTPAYTEQDVKAAVDALHEKWNAEVARMQGYLARNYHLQHGIPWGGQDTNENQRPRTAETLGDVLRSVKLESTPTLEKELGLGWIDEKPDVTPKKPPPAFSLPEE
ncbi:hypothetical protein GJ744_010972 [Endocarpon pusillum]|uniref:PH domain-containing protein n=1 Tax=Endocarpon pusillum TaxID=364733 RepID=A0A8H7AFC4_9EURO|nr:hypothetical protein GJ744_010972 [Endocarpon pusillum]